MTVYSIFKKINVIRNEYTKPKWEIESKLNNTKIGGKLQKMNTSHKTLVLTLIYIYI